MANASLASSLPASTLDRIAPQKGGMWFITDQAENHFTLAYVMDQGTRAVAFRMYPCMTEKEIFNLRETEVYQYNTDATGGNSSLQSEAKGQPLHLILRPHQVVTVDHRLLDLVDKIPISDPGLVQIAAVTQDDGLSLELEKLLFNNQGRQNDSNEDYNWSTTAEIFNNVTQMATNETSPNFPPLFDLNLMMGPDLNCISSNSGDTTLTNGNNEEFMDWNTFRQS